MINKPGRNDLAGQPRARREPRHRLNQGHLNIWVFSPIRKEGVRILEIANKKLKIIIHMVSKAISSQAHKAKLRSFLRIPRRLSSIFSKPSTLATHHPVVPLAAIVLSCHFASPRSYFSSLLASSLLSCSLILSVRSSSGPRSGLQSSPPRPTQPYSIGYLS